MVVGRAVSHSEFGSSGLRWLGAFESGGGPALDEVGGGCIARIAHAVEIIRGEEKHGAGARGLRFSVDGYLQVPFLDNDEFFVGMTVRGMRLFADVQGRDVAFEAVQRGCCRIEQVASLTLWGGDYLSFLPIENGGVHS